jgi:DNA-binding CsgD family transcriptional regulator/tetratricopeptide (TPR) repeat protein
MSNWMSDALTHVSAPIGQMLLERDELLCALHDCLNDLGNGRGKVVSFSGEAGIGKTSLVRAFAEAIPEDALILRGGCEDLSTSRPLGPLFDMCGALDDAFFDVLINDQQPAIIANQLLIRLQRSARPVVMIVEDMHWADEATFDLIRMLARRASDLAMLLVLTYRDNEGESAYQISRLLGSISKQDLIHIPLSPLSLGAISEMCGGDREAATKIQKITNGNPFFVTEIIAGGDDLSHALPRSIRDAVWARMAGRSKEQGALLEALSIMPSGSRRELLADIVAPSQLSELDELIFSGMLIADGAIVRFRHELARRAVMERISDERRRQLHRAVAAWLGNSGTANETTTLTQRMHHARAADDGITIVAIAAELSKRTARMGAHKQAAEFLVLALQHVELLSDEAAAQSYESWSYEAGLALQIDDSVIAARHKAIALWQKLNRPEKIGLNYRWLSRLHWYRGEADDAASYIAKAVEILEAIAPCPELGWSYSVRSQWAMLNDKFDQAIGWGNRAITLAKQFGETEIETHALNNIATSMLLSGSEAEGLRLMEQSLSLAKRHDYHEQAARAYTNMAEYAIAVRNLELARHYLDEGIAFDAEHDLDSWLHYLRGCQARYLMMRGQLGEAAALARDVLAVPNQTRVMQLPAQTVLAHVNLRLGLAGAQAELEEALEYALATKEAQRIAPVRIALAEAAWLEGDARKARRHIDAAFAEGGAHEPWDIGMLYCWAYRSGMPLKPLPDNLPLPLRLECEGQAGKAAHLYDEMGMPFDQAIALCSIAKKERSAALKRAHKLLRAMSAEGAYRRLAELAVQSGVALRIDSIRRGPYSNARAHPDGLTRAEQGVLELLRKGSSNAAIARQLDRSIRTVEHHVAAILSKLDLQSRHQLFEVRDISKIDK